MSAYGHFRPTLRQQLERIANMTDEEIRPLREELERLAEASDEFRAESLSTQARQDRALDLYLSFLRSDTLKEEHQNSSKDVIMQAAFPSDMQKMAELFCAFLSFSFSQSTKAGDRLDDQTLAQYRDDLLFRRDHILLERNEVLPSRKLFDRITETIQQLQKEDGDTDDSEERQEGKGKIQKMLPVED
ncbi:hypothetical protein IWX90DRAFT_253824 [Phyllosticta citrichinensis]|uniref:Uncharacterized protein n=1 Tax=Phyllosticta citrichinensis TaxID=1130410 RepID=A0ABR1XRL8_9PEZI